MVASELIFLNQKFDSQDDFFSFLAKESTENGYTTNTYLSALKERESRFPTGLEVFPGYGIAIPHVDTEHCLTDGVGFISLAEPLVFLDMEEGVKHIAVHYIFPLFLVDKNAHIDILQQMFSLIGQEEFFLGLQVPKDKLAMKLYLEEQFQKGC